MYCHNCGKQIKDGVKHCPHCGSAQDMETSAQAVKSKKGGKKPLLLAGAAVLAAVILLAVVLTRPKTLNVSDYVGIQAEGLNTEGVASLSFDTDKLLADIGEKKALTEREKEAITGLINDAKKDFSLSKSSGLANGDEITIESSLNKKLLKEYGISLKNGSVKVTVADLTEIQEIVLTDYITLEFNGFEGEGYAYITTDYEKLRADIEARVRELADAQEADEFISSELEKYLYSFYAETEPSEKIKNGDEVKVVVHMEDTEIEKYGIRFTWQELSKTAEGLLPTETIAVTDYLECIIQGYNGAGYANVSMDVEELAADLQTFFEEEERGAYGALQENTDIAQEAVNAAENIRDNWRYAFTTTLDREEMLSNGDTVKLESGAETKEYYLPGIGFYLEGGTKEIAVEGLEEPQEVDLAEALNVTFSGVCPNVRAELEIDYDLPYVSLTSLWNMNSSERIVAKNGDVYSGEITYDEQELLRNGYLVTNNKYSYTISGLNSYELSCTSMKDEAVKKLSEELFDDAREELVSERDEIAGEDGRWIVWNEGKIAPDSFKVAYQTDEERTQNRVYLTYHAALSVKGLDRKAQQKDVYVTMYSYNVEETPEGQIADNNDWYCSLFLSEEEAQEFVKNDIAEEMEEAELLADEDSGEELLISCEGDAEISGEAAAEETLQAGEFAGNSKNQAAEIITYEGRTYARYDMELTWDLANTFCQAAGGHLATVTSEREKAVIDRLLEESPYGVYWLGATDAEWEGGWQWVTGEKFVWTDWDSGQPDNASYNDEGEENYLQTGRNFGKHWNDSYMTEPENGFILEIEPLQEQQEAVYLAELTPSSAYNSGVQNYFRDPYGAEHFYSLYMGADGSSVRTYNLGGRWSQLTGNISTWTEADSECIYEIGIWGDGELLFSKYNYRKSDARIPLCLNVEGVETLCIQVRGYGSTYNGYLFLNEGKLFAGENSEALTETSCILADVQMVDAAGYGYEPGTGMAADINGTIRRDIYTFYAPDNSYAIWNLDGAYTSMDAVLYAASDYYEDETSGRMEIFLDGERALSTEDCTIFEAYQTVSVDLTGKKVMEIRTTGNPEGGDLYLCLADTVLKRLLPEKTEEEEPKMQFPEILAAVEQRAAKTVTCGNNRYYLFEEPLTWQQADAFCQAAGAVLACPTNAGKNEALRSLAENGRCESYWIGGRLTKSVWSWSDGTEFGDYVNWADGQPDNMDEKEFLLGMYRDGRWNDFGAEEMTGFIMETAAVSGQKPENAIRLSDMEWQNSHYCESCNSYSIDRERPSAVTLNVGSIEMNASENAGFSVELGGKYSSLEGSIAVYSGASDNVCIQFAIFGDGRLLYELRDIRRDMEEVSFSTDLTGVNVLTVVSKNTGSYENGYLYFDNELQSAGAPEEAAAAKRLSDIILVDEANVYREGGLYTDAYGRLHDGFLEMNAGENAKVLYNLEGGYTSFAGTITAGNDTAPGKPVTVQICADGEVLHTISDFDKHSEPAAFEVDITDRSTLEIVVSAEEETWIYLTDDQVTAK